MFKNLLRVLCAAVLLFLLHAAFWFDQGRNFLVVHRALPDQFLNFGEVQLALLMLVFALPAAHLVARSIQGLPPIGIPCAAFAKGRFSFLLLAAFASCGAFAIAHFCHDYAWFTDDEQAYLFQAKSYLNGSLTGAVIEPHHVFHHSFVVKVGSAGNQRLAGVYPILQPFLMSLSMRLGNANISQFLTVGALVYNAARFAETLLKSRRCGLIVAWLCATSPMLLGLGSTYHTAVLAATLSVVTARSVLWFFGSGGLWRGALVGLCAGSIVLARPMEGVLVVLMSGAALGVWGLNSAKNWRQRLFALLGFGLGGLLPFAAFAGANLGTTGELLAGPYKVLEQQIGGFFGFGDRMMWGRTHSVWHGINQTVSALIRMNNWHFAWPVSTLVPLLALAPPFRDRRISLLLLISAVQLLAYFFLAFGSVHDFGSAYHVWHLAWMATATAWVIERSGQLLQRWRPAHTNYAMSLGVALTVVGIFTFWPWMVVKWHDVGNVVREPVRVAERASGGKPAVILWENIQPPRQPHRTWVFRAPAPHETDSMLWARDVPSFYPALKKAYPTHEFYRLKWHKGTATVREFNLP